MQYFADECKEFQEAVADAVRSVGATPLRTIWCCDEIVPGNVLSPANHRKFWAFYVGFADMPRHRSSQEQWWLPVALLRSSIASSVVGGLSNCFKLLLRDALFEPSQLATVGVALQLGRPVLARISVGSIIADESALKALWDSKGASGTKPCLFCGNLVSLMSGLADEIPRLIDVSCCDHRRFQLCSDTDIWSAYDRLASLSGRVTKADFGVQERAAGLNYSPDSLLGDRQLRKHLGPVSVTRMDWMHNLCVNGVGNKEIHIFLERCKEQLGGAVCISPNFPAS